MSAVRLETVFESRRLKACLARGVPSRAVERLARARAREALCYELELRGLDEPARLMRVLAKVVAGLVAALCPEAREEAEEAVLRAFRRGLGECERTLRSLAEGREPEGGRDELEVASAMLRVLREGGPVTVAAVAPKGVRGAVFFVVLGEHYLDPPVLLLGVGEDRELLVKHGTELLSKGKDDVTHLAASYRVSLSELYERLGRL